MAPRRKPTAVPADATPAKPRIFIGSSAEAAKDAAVLAKALSHQCTPEPWTTGGVFPASSRPADSLLTVLGRADFGVFLFTPDDVVFSRGAKRPAVRDNVLVELGMAIGRLGVDRSYVVVPRGDKLKLPSDLSGVQPITYDQAQLASDQAVTLGLVATDIMHAAAVAVPRSHPATSAIADLANKLTTSLSQLAAWRAGLNLNQPPPEQFKWWAEAALSAADDACRRVVSNLPADAYVAWMLPRLKGKRHLLEVAHAYHLPTGYNHYPFALGEGAAGTTWATGELVTHSKDAPFPGWLVRPGCENATYICVPVGQKGGAGGVLAVGSDVGFRPTFDMLSVLRLFASVLAVATG